MPRRNQAHVEAAKRLLAAEIASHEGLGVAAAAGQVYDRLFIALGPVIGGGGVRALLARSAKLHEEELPCLTEALSRSELRAVAEPTSEHLVACLAELEPAVAANVATHLYATLLALMSAFIGDRLVAQLLKTTFPTLSETQSKETE